MKQLKAFFFLLTFGMLLLPDLFAQNISVGETLPNFELQKYDGGSIAVNDYPNRILFLHFLASY